MRLMGWVATSLLLASAGCTQSSAPLPTTTGASSAPVAQASSQKPVASAPPPAPTCTATRVEAKAPCAASVGHVASLALTPDGSRAIAAVSNDEAQDVLALDLKRGSVEKVIASLAEYTGEIDVAFHAGAKRAALVGVSDSHYGVGLFELDTWKEIAVDPNIALQFPTGATFSPDGSMLLVGTLIGTHATYDAATGKVAGSVSAGADRMASHHESPLGWSADSKLVEAEGVRDALTMKPVKKAPKKAIIPIAFAPAGDLAAVVSDAGVITLYHADPTGKSEWKKDKTIDATKDVKNLAKVGQDPKSDDVHPPPVFELAWSADGQRLAAMLNDGRVRVYTAAGELDKEVRVGIAPVLSVSEGAAATLAWADADHLVALVESDATVELLDLKDGQRRVLEGDDGEGAPNFVLSPDKSQVLTTRTSKIWSTKTGAALATLESFQADPVWLDDDKVVGYVDEEGALRLARLADSATLSLWVVGPVKDEKLVARTVNGLVKSAVKESATCGPDDVEGGPVMLELRDALLEDFWAGRPLKPVCPSDK
ncbi:MAG: WD40 repeat domain-containing protein [Polyangiaceae bacterium]